jgi:hypothetical protein
MLFLAELPSQADVKDIDWTFAAIYAVSALLFVLFYWATHALAIADTLSEQVSGLQRINSVQHASRHCPWAALL